MWEEGDLQVIKQDLGRSPFRKNSPENRQKVSPIVSFGLGLWFWEKLGLEKGGCALGIGHSNTNGVQYGQHIPDLSSYLRGTKFLGF